MSKLQAPVIRYRKVTRNLEMEMAGTGRRARPRCWACHQGGAAPMVGTKKPCGTTPKKIEKRRWFCLGNFDCFRIAVYFFDLIWGIAILMHLSSMKLRCLVSTCCVTSSLVQVDLQTFSWTRSNACKLGCFGLEIPMVYRLCLEISLFKHSNSHRLSVCLGDKALNVPALHAQVLLDTAKWMMRPVVLMSNSLCEVSRQDTHRMAGFLLS